MFFANHNSNLKAVEWVLHSTLFGVLLAGLFFAQSYWQTTLQVDQAELRREIRQIKKKLNNAEQIVSEHQRLKEMKQAIEDRAEIVRDRIPEQPNEGEFLRQTTSAARECGITITEYLRRGIETHDDHSRLMIHISLKGAFANLCRFVDQLERLPRISKVSRLKVGNLKGQENEYPMELTLILFFRSEQEEFRVARAIQ